MASPRTVSHPPVRTYIEKTVGANGRETVHVRVYAPKYNVDRRGTGRNAAEAIQKAKKDIAQLERSVKG